MKVGKNIYVLNQDDFKLTRGKQGPVMGVNIVSVALIFFLSDNCPKCDELKPEYKKLASIVNSSVELCYVDLSKNRKIVEMAKKSVNPIKGVPTLTIYVRGMPYMNYKGSRNAKSINTFINHVLVKIGKVKSSSNVNTNSRRNNEPNVRQQTNPPKDEGVESLAYDDGSRGYASYETGYDQGIAYQTGGGYLSIENAYTPN